MKVITTEEASILEAGSWVEYDGSQFKIAHMSNLGFQRSLNRLNQPFKRKIENGTLDPAISKQNTCRAMASDLLLDWKDVQNGDGSQLAFSETAAFNALMNDPSFREFVADYAANFDNFRKGETEELGNS